MKNMIKRLWKTYSKVLPDSLYIQLEYKKHLGCFPNLNKPVTFNEKIQWLKLHDRNPLYTTMVDKFKVKEFVSQRLGPEVIIPTIGVWENFDEINFDNLPNQFVLKCTHDSAGLVIVKDKRQLNKEEAKRKLTQCLKRNYYYSGREWPYKNVLPRIIAEKYMEDKEDGELRDYKFFCFHGEVKCFKVDFNRFVRHQANYYDPLGNLIDFGEASCPPDPSVKLRLPAKIPEMKQMAEQLSAGIPFLRVDFYNVQGTPYFGELTFFPDSGFGKFVNKNQDAIMGKWLSLPISLE